VAAQRVLPQLRWRPSAPRRAASAHDGTVIMIGDMPRLGLVPTITTSSTKTSCLTSRSGVHLSRSTHAWLRIGARWVIFVPRGCSDDQRKHITPCSPCGANSSCVPCGAESVHVPVASRVIHRCRSCPDKFSVFIEPLDDQVRSSVFGSGRA
jgi:hypothetical protein